jgi:hypothetical protein
MADCDNHFTEEGGRNKKKGEVGRREGEGKEREGEGRREGEVREKGGRREYLRA